MHLIPQSRATARVVPTFVNRGYKKGDRKGRPYIFGKQRTEDGKWRMEDGKWRMENGGWRAGEQLAFDINLLRRSDILGVITGATGPVARALVSRR
jgi:hypothetical protein